MSRAVVSTLLASALFASVSLPMTAARATDPVPFRSADMLPTDSPSVQGVKRMGEIIRERSGRHLSIDSLGADNKDSETYTINQVKNGQIDMARLNVAVLSSALPEVNVLSLPYLFRSRQEMRHALDGPIGRELLEKMESGGLIGLCFYDMGARGFYSRKPIRSAADMKGLLVQIPTSEAAVDTVRALGAQPVPMPFARVKAALESRAIDAAENTLAGYFGGRHYRAAPYFAATRHSWAPGVVVFSKAVWDTLTPQDHLIIRDAARTSAAYVSSQLDAYEAMAIEKARQAGAEIVDVDVGSFEAALSSVGSDLLTNADLKKFADRIRPPSIANMPDQQPAK
ncbi:MAG TPA: TRAP transporter substrate-binding protein DctP [Reyranella sp.]|nr:TRAP transporter substrate-binding protein DctP [Reyranella sp.]